MADEIEDSTEISLREFYQETAHYQQQMYDASSTYNQVIVLAGYAAFFGVWSAFSNEIPKWVMLLSGGLILVSVIVYVGWIVANMLMIKTGNDRIIRQIEGGLVGFRERTLEAERQNVRAVLKMMRFWKPVVAIAGGSALIGSVLLAGSAIANAVDRLNHPSTEIARKS